MSQEQNILDVTAAGGYNDALRWAVGLEVELSRQAQFFSRHVDLYGQPTEESVATGLLGFLRESLESQDDFHVTQVLDLNKVEDLEAPGEHRRVLAGIESASTRTGVISEQRLFEVAARSGYADFDRVLVTQIKSTGGTFTDRRYVMLACQGWHVSSTGHPTEGGLWWKPAGVIGAVQSPSTGEITAFRASARTEREDNGASTIVGGLLAAMRLQWVDNLVERIQSLV